MTGGAEPGTVRLQKFLSNAGVASRRACEQLIRDGEVTVNGVMVTDMGVKIDPARDRVRCRNRAVTTTAHRHLYLMYNKPAGVVTTMQDEAGRPCVGEVVRVRGRFFPVGRLDRATRGLLLLTSDGDWAAAIQHPSNKVPKVYQVWLKGRPSPSQIERLGQPFVINGATTKAARVSAVHRHGTYATLKLTIYEGKYHQVRLMCRAAGVELTDLQRVRIGGLSLGVAEGKWRALTADEVQAVCSPRS